MTRKDPPHPRKARRRTVFTLDAPQAKEVLLMGDFNGWNTRAHPMKRHGDGVWRKTTYLYPGRYEYRFRVDGNWCCDPGNPQRCRNCFGSENSVVEIAPRP